MIILSADSLSVVFFLPVVFEFEEVLGGDADGHCVVAGHGELAFSDGGDAAKGGGVLKNEVTHIGVDVRGNVLAQAVDAIEHPYHAAVGGQPEGETMEGIVDGGVLVVEGRSIGGVGHVVGGIANGGGYVVAVPGVEGCVVFRYFGGVVVAGEVLLVALQVVAVPSVEDCVARGSVAMIDAVLIGAAQSTIGVVIVTAVPPVGQGVCQVSVVVIGENG